jgi:hypothetical protein
VPAGDCRGVIGSRFYAAVRIVFYFCAVCGRERNTGGSPTRVRSADDTHITDDDGALQL